MDNWDDIRIFIAAARAGSGAAGARDLRVDQSTVSRRLSVFEKRLGVRLFDRSGSGYALSPAGERLYASALRIEEEIVTLDRALVGQDQSLSGTIRVATADTLSNHLLFPVTSSFLQRYPDINLRILTSYDVVALDGIEADVALRVSNTPHESLVGRKLATAAFAMYGSREYVSAHDNRVERMVWLNWDDGSASSNWPQLMPTIPDSACRLRIDSVPSLLEAARQGVGATILPCFMGDADATLTRIQPAKVISHRDIWLLVHEDLRYTARIRAFLDHMVETIKPMRDLIEGRKPQP